MNNIVDSKIFENPNKTIYQALLDISEQFPNFYALGFYGKRTTYKELIANVNDVAKALIKAGVKRGDAVTFMLPNCPQAVAVYYAINRIGAVANMVNPLAPVDALGFYINKPKSKFVVTIDSLCEKVKQVDNNLNVMFIKLSDDMSDEVKFAFAQKNAGAPVPNTDNCIYIKDLIENSIDIELPPVEYVPDTTAMILYSGGTTGTPKGVCLSDKNINANICYQLEIVGCSEVVAGKRNLSIMPFFHSFGIMFGLHVFLCAGYDCVIVPQFNLEECINTIIKEKINFLSVIPSIYEAMMKSDAFDGLDLSHIECTSSAGDTMPIDLQKRLNAFFKEHNSNAVFREGYGLTETTTACTGNPKNDVRPGSVGIPFGKTKVRVVKPGTFEDLTEGEKGELIVSNDSVMLGYLDDPEETAKVLRKDVDGLTWLFTGDMCYIENGYVYFVQRIKRLIKSAGNNIYPLLIERVINECECVRQSCVVGVKNKLVGQIVCACIILNDGYEERQSKIDIVTACRKMLEVYEIPTKIVFLNEFPLTKVGKIDFMTLEKMQNEKARF